MTKSIITSLIFLSIVLGSCNSEKSNRKFEIQNVNHSEPQIDTLTKHLKPFKAKLPTIGLLMYNGVLQGEVIATSDVFAKPTEEGKQLFNVVTIAQTEIPITTEEGIRILPDYTFKNCPRLEALFVPSAYDMYSQVHNDKIIEFIKEKNDEAKYIVSNCGGTQLIGASGIADGKKM